MFAGGGGVWLAWAGELRVRAAAGVVALGAAAVATWATSGEDDGREGTKGDAVAVSGAVGGGAEVVAFEVAGDDWFCFN